MVGAALRVGALVAGGFGRRRPAVAVMMVMSLACGLGAVAAAPAAAAAPVANVFPIPGAHYAAPQSQITIRGVPTSQWGPISVIGSASGRHSGAILGDSDGHGGSFAPAVPFTAGEVVTVTLPSLDIEGSGHDSYSFQVANPAPGFPVLHWPPAGRVKNDVQTFKSRPDLEPASVTVTKHGATGDGDIFLDPQWGPVQDGPMILDPNGNLLWFDNMKGEKGDDSASDFMVQSYHGQRVLTWWQGHMVAGIGVGQDIIFNSAYQQIATVSAGNGLAADLHEFRLTPQGTALVIADYPVMMNASAVRGASSNAVVMDSVVQEIDIPTGLVLFQWDSLDHIPITDTYTPPPKNPHNPFDVYHLNSVLVDDDGNLLLSARNTWAGYKVNRLTGQVMWELGGRHNSFKLLPDTYWAWQHDIEPRAQNDQYLTIFDDEASPQIHPQSRAIKVKLNLKHMTARMVGLDEHAGPLLANYEGNYEQLGNGDNFIGWGQQPYFSDYNSRGQQVFDAHLNSFSASYRAYRFHWTGVPATLPALATAPRGRTKMAVWMSWNGATSYTAWRVLGGSSATALRTLATARRTGFETGIDVPVESYVQVQALDSHGNVMRSSAVTKR